MSGLYRKIHIVPKEQVKGAQAARKALCGIPLVQTINTVETEHPLLRWTSARCHEFICYKCWRENSRPKSKVKSGYVRNGVMI